MSGTSPVKVGDRAPSFSIPNQDGSLINLDDLLGKKPIILFFYPKDDTPGCIAESCAFRDSYTVFQGMGAEVIGISADTSASHRQFATRYQLPFTLLSDVGDQVRDLYGVPSTLLIIPGRVTYVIDLQGIVRHVFDSQLDFNAHVRESLSVLKRIKRK